LIHFYKSVFRSELMFQRGSGSLHYGNALGQEGGPQG